MMKIITEVFKMPSGSIIPLLYAVKEDGQVDRAVTDTLCEFVSHLFPPADKEFESLLAQVDKKRYLPINPLLADFGVNDVNAWLVAPHVKDGGLSISNENIPDYSIDDGQPQNFSMKEFHAIFECWKNFQKIIQEKGAESILGEKFETLIP
jgi:hypothetical protein